MNPKKLKEIINDGESSTLEFKRDSISGEELAIVLISFLNSQGGTLLVGVEDDEQISGITGDIDTQLNRISQICHSTVKPAIIPEINVIKIQDKNVISVYVEKGLQKPYYLIKKEKILFYIRVGTTSRLASPEQIAVLYSNHPLVHYELTPVLELTLDLLDDRLMEHYFFSLKKISSENFYKNKEKLLKNSCLATRVAEQYVATLAGGLLFCPEPGQFISSAGIRCAAFRGTTKDYSMLDKKFIDVPILTYKKEEITMREGLIDFALHFIEKNTKVSSRMDGIRRIDTPEYPYEALREAVTNAVVHRDYSLIGGQIQVLIFSDRIEIRSPGRLSNSLTIEMIEDGASYPRNPVLMKFAENYGYVEHLGLGIPEKIIKPMLKMAYPKPEFIDTGYEFVVILRKSLIK